MLEAGLEKVAQMAKQEQVIKLSAVSTPPGFSGRQVRHALGFRLVKLRKVGGKGGTGALPSARVLEIDQEFNDAGAQQRANLR